MISHYCLSISKKSVIKSKVNDEIGNTTPVQRLKNDVSQLHMYNSKSLQLTSVPQDCAVPTKLNLKPFK